MAHQGGLVVARLGLSIAGIGDRAPVRLDQEELTLDTALHPVAGLVRPRDLSFERDARRGLDRHAVHPQIGGKPANLGFPRQLDQGFGVGDREHVGIGGGHVEPGGEAGETRAVLLHAADRPRRHQLGTQAAEEIDEADEEVLNLPLFRDFGEIDRHL